MIRTVIFNTRRGTESEDCIVLRRYEGQKIMLALPFNPDFGYIRLSTTEGLTLLEILEQAHSLTSDGKRSQILFFPFGEEEFGRHQCFLIRGNNHFLEIDRGFSDFIPIYLYGREIYELREALKEILDIKQLHVGRGEEPNETHPIQAAGVAELQSAPFSDGQLR
ncbi:hypothetical protein [Paenibacillus oleatilyticus]|uniref:hypothetical protein n=1 Tax=Paenibacillus oleatilyticus TaxID=2594886 RepID=UPI001C1FC19B|nr:hypothetical protein [Paenibacillus oleatilyticus]MBU7319030.1 hypothetical protein [Paenibacillus oleatilyticus]